MSRITMSLCLALASSGLPVMGVALEHQAQEGSIDSESDSGDGLAIHTETVVRLEHQDPGDTQSGQVNLGILTAADLAEIHRLATNSPEIAGIHAFKLLLPLMAGANELRVVSAAMTRVAGEGDRALPSWSDTNRVAGGAQWVDRGGVQPFMVVYMDPKAPSLNRKTREAIEALTTALVNGAEALVKQRLGAGAEAERKAALAKSGAQAFRNLLLREIDRPYSRAFAENNPGLVELSPVTITFGMSMSTFSFGDANGEGKKGNGGTNDRGYLLGLTYRVTDWAGITSGVVVSGAAGGNAKFSLGVTLDIAAIGRIWRN